MCARVPVCESVVVVLGVSMDLCVCAIVVVVVVTASGYVCMPYCMP